MTTLANLLWVVTGGILIAAIYLFAGLLLILTIIGFPFGVQCIKLAGLGLFPFGKEVYDKPTAYGFLAVLFNVIWILLGGFWIAVMHLVLAILFGITIIGLPVAKQHIKLTSVALLPFGKGFKNL
jgi:uncharacterized membrane protein YccF (DUF307 family)